MDDARGTERIQTVIVGGGQAGLAVGYHLARRNMPLVILDASGRVGDAWGRRWDSLRLFTPARFDGLPGMRFPGPRNAFPTKDAMGDFLEAYAGRFQLPVRRGTRVESLSRPRDRFVLSSGSARFEAENVVVAMSNFQRPRVPSFANELDPGIRQLHATEYRNPAQLQAGGVLIVGAGNSGSEIATELAGTRAVWMAGPDTGHVPFRIETPIARLVLIRLVRFVGHHVLNVSTPIGRRVRPKLLHQADPLIRVKPKDLAAAGVERVPRVAGARAGKPVLEDGRVLDPSNVVWCTGFNPDFSWIDLPVFGEDGEPMHERGIVPSQPGLYFVGLHFLTAMTSSLVTGVGRDAHRVALAIASHAREGSAEPLAG
ncbi:MAG: portal protein [Actinobacteria bacterium]|nr:MAG: portal protein [Actinomycetota bacterium]